MTVLHAEKLTCFIAGALPTSIIILPFYRPVNEDAVGYNNLPETTQPVRGSAGFRHSLCGPEVPSGSEPRPLLAEAQGLRMSSWEGEQLWTQREGPLVQEPCFGAGLPRTVQLAPPPWPWPWEVRRESASPARGRPQCSALAHQPGSLQPEGCEAHLSTGSLGGSKNSIITVTSGAESGACRP